jgi:gluconolactonase
MTASGNRQDQIVAAGERLECLWNDGCVLTEGVAAGHDGAIYFSDITRTFDCGDHRGMEAGHIWRYDPRDGSCRVFRSPSGMANGLAFDADGSMVAAEGADHGGRRVTLTDMAGGRAYILASGYDGRPFNAPNDVWIDLAGRIWVTDPRYYGHEPIEQPLMGVYRIDPDRSVRLVVTDAAKPNGVAVSPDQKTLYVGSTDSGSFARHRFAEGTPFPDRETKVFAYDLDPDGIARNRRVFADYRGRGGADGMTIDTEGFLYVTVRIPGEAGVYVYTPSGDLAAMIASTELPTNVEFGRDEAAHLLYVTAGRGLYRIRTKRRGFHLPKRGRTA